MAKYQTIKNRTQYQVSPVEENHALVFLQKSQSALILTAKLQDGSFVPIGKKQEAQQDLDIVAIARRMALIYG